LACSTVPKSAVLDADDGGAAVDVGDDTALVVVPQERVVAYLCRARHDPRLRFETAP
jgi:hypothetical protein